MIQILGLRDGVSPTGARRKYPVFFNKQWRLESIDDVFNEAKLNTIITQVNPNERYNLYFTVADCFEEKERELKAQWAIPFDIDDIRIPSEEEAFVAATRVAEVAAAALGVPLGEIGALFSGNGVQLFIRLLKPFTSKDYFDQMRDHYGALCERIDKALTIAGLQGKVDTSVWSAARLMRLPNTENRKEGKPRRQARIINGTLIARDFNPAEESGMKPVLDAKTVPDSVLKSYPPPDTKAVLSGCKFLAWSGANPAAVREYQWYADQSITARLDGGRELVHRRSEGHPQYNYEECDTKIDQALRASGPRTCADINTRWDGCGECPHWGKITSPIMIRGPDYISTAATGYRKVSFGDDGKARLGKPHYQDIIRKFQQDHLYAVLEKSEQVYVYLDKHWEHMSETRLRAWMTELVRPEPAAAEMAEFLAQLKARHVRNIDWFYSQSAGRMNFQNCVLDLSTMETETHKPEHGFLNVLPFDYDPNATCPNWDGYIQDWMANDPDMVQLLHEFAGYCVSGDPLWLHKVLILTGDGENGKSIFMETIKRVVGKGNYSVLPIEQMSIPERRYSLIRSMYNYTEEASVNAFMNNEALKTMTGGGEIEVRALFEMSFSFVNKCKFVISANNPPDSKDKSHAMYRRLMFVPFNVVFAEGDPRRIDRRTMDARIGAELPGICNRFIQAYNGVRKRESFVKPAASVAALEAYRIESDPIVQFSREALVVSADAEECKDEVFQRYVMFCRDHEERPLNSTWFWRQLKRHLKDRVQETRDGAGDATGRRRHLVKGIKLLGKEI